MVMSGPKLLGLKTPAFVPPMLATLVRALPEGPGWEYVELVWRELGKDPSPLARATGPAGGPDRGEDGVARG